MVWLYACTQNTCIKTGSHFETKKVKILCTSLQNGRDNILTEQISINFENIKLKPKWIQEVKKDTKLLKICKQQILQGRLKKMISQLKFPLERKDSRRH